jgi:predicted Rdx family selenoprotein
LKQIIRDIIEPEKKLGHSDIKPNIMEVPPEN